MGNKTWINTFVTGLNVGLDDKVELPIRPVFSDVTRNDYGFLFRVSRNGETYQCYILHVPLYLLKNFHN